MARTSPTDDPTARATLDAFEALLDEAPDLRAALPPDLLGRLERYVALLLDANRRVNLTRIVEPAAIARLHLLDALAALPLLDGAQIERAIDIGSGGGVPGIPLALARPAWRWTLVESTGRKATVLVEFVERLGLRQVHVAAERAETLGGAAAHREGYDLATARAVATLPVLAELAFPFLRPGGRLLAWKGRLGDQDEEIDRGRSAVAQLGGGELRIRAAGPALGDHRLVAIVKRAVTPERFPRRVGEAARRPLA